MTDTALPTGYTPRLKAKYQAEIAKAMTDKCGYKNVMEVPRIEKITLNMGVSEAVADKKVMDNAVADLTKIAGQKPVTTKSRKAIAGFKIREGYPIGTMVTLRGARMYEFLDRFITVALPRVRDFRGVNGKSFDGRGNYNIGVKEQIIFPEVEYDKVDALRGLTVAAMLLVNNPGDWGHVYPPLLHADWNGCTPTDLVFPFFLFVMGASVALAILPFAFTTILALYYMAETNLRFLLGEYGTVPVPLIRGTVGANTTILLQALILISVVIGAVSTASEAWTLGDIGVGLMAWLNIVGIIILQQPAFKALRDYEKQKKEGKDPIFDPIALGIVGATFWESYGRADDRPEEVTLSKK
mgnify:CR=1 FL=1